jgi:N-acetylated-alpha-linked acidic dipeptidase
LEVALTRYSVLASWDGEEYGLLGSTEWTEENINWLTETTVAYLNIDVAVAGPRPDLSATPELGAIATEIMKKVVHPNFGSFNQSLYDSWFDVSEGEIGVLGSGSDYSGFLYNGITSVSFFQDFKGLIT